MILILTASPNKDGLTAACAAAAERGVRETGTPCETICLNDLSLRCCAACGNGWGICREQGRCVIEDSFSDVQDKARAASAIALITPVYWAQPAESMKVFLDRFRRCETTRRETHPLGGKPVLLVAAAGGSGNGTIQALAEMEMWCRQVGVAPFERLGVTRRIRQGMLEVIEEAAYGMAEVKA